jgi:hypothetical protein
MIGKKRWLLAILVIFAVTACASMQSDLKKGPPLPNDIKIIPPAPDLRKDIAAFSGKWVGSWARGISYEVMLVVEEIHDSWAQVVFSRGDEISTEIDAAYLRTRGKVIFDRTPKLVVDTFKLRNGGDIYFQVRDADTLEMSAIFRGGGANGTLKRTY